MKKDFTQQITGGEFQAQYWQAAPSRKELQDVLDEYSQLFQTLTLTITKLDLIVSCLAERAGLTPDDVQAYAHTHLPQPEGQAENKSGVIVEG